MSHPLTDWLKQFRSIFAKETLPPPPDGASMARPRRPGFASLLFSIESPPYEPERPARRRARGALAMLFAPEPLPLDPPRPPERHRTHWFAWLFRVERIDDLPDSDSPEVH